jgi:hypothetical protein
MATPANPAAASRRIEPDLILVLVLVLVLVMVVVSLVGDGPRLAREP